MESRTDLLEIPLEERIKQALNSNTTLIEEFTLDEIDYIIRGYPQLLIDGSYAVLWTRFDGTVSHGGQQVLLGFRDDYDFEEHDTCGVCHPASETSYWASMRNVWIREKLKFMIRDWTPEDEFWNVSA